MRTENIGACIARLRKEKGMTQQALASKLQITDKAVSKWERGLSCPDIAILPQIAEILDVNVDDLLSHPQIDKQHPFIALTQGDIKEMLLLLCRCVSLALAMGGLIIYLMDGLTLSDLAIMLCIAAALISIDGLFR